MKQRFLSFYVVLGVIVLACACLAFITLSPGAAVALYRPLEAFASSSNARFATFAVFIIPVSMALAQAFFWHRDTQAEYWAIDEMRKAQIACGDRPVMRDSYESGFLEALDETTVFRVAKTQTSATIRAIWEDVHNSRFDPLSSILDQHKPHLLAASARLGAYQAIAIRLGILGTFVGLVLSLGDAKDLLTVAQQASEANGTVSAASVGSVVNNLSVAFGTSIGGLVAALLITLLANVMRAEDLALITKLEHLSSGLQGFFRSRKSDDHGLVHTAQQLREDIQANKDQVIATRDVLQAEADRLKAAAEDFRGAVNKPGELIVDNVAALETLLGNLNESLARFGRIGDQVSALEGEALSALTGAISKVEQQQSAKLDQLVAALTQARDQDADALAKSADEAASKVSAAMMNFSDVIEKGVRDTARIETVQSINKQLGGVEEQFVSLVQTQARWLRGQVLIMTVLGVSVLGLSSLYVFSRPSAQASPVHAVDAAEPAPEPAPQPEPDLAPAPTQPTTPESDPAAAAQEDGQ